MSELHGGELHALKPYAALVFALQFTSTPSSLWYDLRILESFQAPALRVYLGLEAGTSNIGIVAKARPVLSGIMRCQETFRALFRYQRCHEYHHFSKLGRTESSSLRRHVHCLFRYGPALNPLLPRIFQVLGASSRVIRQLRVDWIAHNHHSRIHICRNRSTTDSVFLIMGVIT